MVNSVKKLIYAVALVLGFAFYLVTKKTPVFGYRGMVKLFCATGGRSNDILSRLIGIVKRPYRFEKAVGVLGDLSTTTSRAAIVAKLRERGYFTFERQLPPEICERLLLFATSQPCDIRPGDGQCGNPIAAVYRRNSPEAVRYDFSARDLLSNSDVQALLADRSFAALAQDYLGTRPVIDVLAMWWHTNFSDKPDSQAAQFFHFDMDRPKWLKFFIYLTDVESVNGPHSFVSGSHRTGGIPPDLLSKGYTRLEDVEVAALFDDRDIMEFSAPRGTIIVEDTRGLHKGKHVERGDRLILQIQFSNSLFGAEYPKTCLDSKPCAALLENIKKYPKLYANYLD